MSTGKCSLQVKKVVRGMVDQLAKQFEEEDSLLVAENKSVDTEHQGDGDVRRSVRARKEPDRLATKVAAPKQPRERKKKEEIVVPDIEMSPPPAGLRGILKRDRLSLSSTQSRQQYSLSTASKSIIKKYRKVRVNRKLQYKVIAPLPGWRPDRTRMPEDEPDEDEKKRLAEMAEAGEVVEKKRRKRKSIGQATLNATLASVMDDTGMDDEEEESSAGGSFAPSSPDFYFEAYMKDASPDSVLATDNEDEETLRNPAASKSLFPPIGEDSNEDTVESGGDTVAGKRPDRRRSVRGQPPEDEKPPAPAKKERRKSQMFMTVPRKESPLKPVKVVRRRSGVLPVHKEEQEGEEKTEEETSSSRMPWTEGTCRSEDTKEPLREKSRSKRKSKVADWLAAEPAAEVGGEDVVVEDGEIPDDQPITSIPDERETAKEPEKAPLRKGRRSMKVVKEVTTGNGRGKENKKPAAVKKEEKAGASKSKRKGVEEKKKKEEKEKDEKKEERKLHPFFAKTAPKPETTVTVAAATVPSTAPAEKKANRRRSMFVPKKPVVVVKKAEEEEKDDDDVVEIVGEVIKKKEEEEVGEVVGDAAQSGRNNGFWRSTEIDAAPYTGLVHVGREEKEEESGSEGEGIVKKMRRLSVTLPRLSSYAVPSSVRGGEAVGTGTGTKSPNQEPEASEMVAVFDDEEGKEKGRSKRAAALVERAHGLAAAAAADASCSWPESMRPRRVDECMGDEEVLATGKRWLQKWKKRLDTVCAEEEKATKGPKVKRKKRRGGNHSDESELEDSDSDYELRDDEHCRLPNPLVISGPIGCGKTAYIRALSEEVGFCLLESGPDERRSGNQLRAKFAGAVDNHRMSSRPSASGLASFFAPKNGETKRKEKEDRLHTLVVIEHVDVVFTEEDRLFWPALAEILATTKIPVVLTCNVVPDELQRVLRVAEEAGSEPMEMTLERAAGREVQEYVEASLAGSTGRVLSSTVIRGIVSRARGDLRAALHDAHWAAAAAAINQSDIADSSMRRVDDPSVCDTVAAQSFVWSDECARRADANSNSELSHAAQWPTRCGMPGEVYARLCTQIDEIDQDAQRVAAARAERTMEMARSGLGAGNGGRSGLLTRREIATDWMPVLEQIDRREQEKKRTVGRRHQHYFNVIKNMDTGLSIDPLDRIQGACAFFRLPQSREEPQ